MKIEVSERLPENTARKLTIQHNPDIEEDGEVRVSIEGPKSARYGVLWLDMKDLVAAARGIIREWDTEPSS